MSVTVVESWFSGWLAGQAEHDLLPAPPVIEIVPAPALAPWNSPSSGTSACPTTGRTPAGASPAPGLTPAGASPAPGHPCVAVLAQLGKERAALDAALVRAVSDLVDTCRDSVLDERGWYGTDLTPSQRRTLTRDTKRRAITETQTALGVRTREATTLVALATGPAPVRNTVLGALDRGETTWAQARRVWEHTTAPARGLTEDQQTPVTHALYGTDPTLAAPERLDPDGHLTLGTPWPQATFEATLTREITACEGTDITAERERRHRAHAARTAHVRVHDDGTATLTLTGPLTSVLAAHTRHDTIARTLRAQGHPHTLAQLATDTMLTTLTHGTLHLDTLPHGPTGTDMHHSTGH